MARRLQQKKNGAAHKAGKVEAEKADGKKVTDKKVDGATQKANDEPPQKAKKVKASPVAGDGKVANKNKRKNPDDEAAHTPEKVKASPAASNEAQPPRTRKTAKGPWVAASSKVEQTPDVPPLKQPVGATVATEFEKTVKQLASTHVSRSTSSPDGYDDEWQVPSFGHMMVDTIGDRRFF